MAGLLKGQSSDDNLEDSWSPLFCFVLMHADIPSNAIR